MRLGLGLGLASSYRGGDSPSPPSYTFLGEHASAGTGHVETYSVDIGSAAADRYILLCATVQNPDPVPVSVTVAGVALTLLSTAGTPSSTSYMSVFYGGLVTTGSGFQNAAVTWTSASFENKCMMLWSLNNLASTTPKASGGQTTQLPAQAVTVAVGDLVFFAASAPSGITTTFANTSSTTPTGQRSTAATQHYSADWLIASAGTLTINTPIGAAQRNYVSFA